VSIIAPFGKIHTVVGPGYETVTNDVIPPGEFRIWNNATMEVGEVACQKKMRCHEWCHVYQTGDFTSPDVPTQPNFEGSRRQFLRRVDRLFGEHDEVDLNTLAHRIRLDHT